LVRSAVIAPVHNYLLTTETGARVNSAYNAHLVPFYEKHAVPIVDAASAFVTDTAVPVLYSVTEPVRDTVSRHVVEPYRERVGAVYAKYLGPTVDATTGAVSVVVDQWVTPVVATGRAFVVYVAEYVVPMGSSAVNDYVVPFYRDTVYPRWNEQIRPALCRYSKIVVHYTRTEVLPAFGDGASRGYVVSRDFAMTHIVPHAKRATIYTYVFLRTHVTPPIRRLYEQNLQAHVDRVVPWEHVTKVSGAVKRVGCGFLAFVKGFAEEFYFMCYTIVTGDEHPLVVSRLKKAEEEMKKTTTTTAAEAAAAKMKAVVEKPVEMGQQLQGLARKLSGSARQWIQVARGWVGSAASTAMGGVVSYESRMRATASLQWSQATEAVDVVTSVIAEELYPTESAVTTSESVVVVVVKEETSEELVVTAEDVIKRPDAHVASFVNVDTEYLREFVVETPAEETPIQDEDEEETPVEETRASESAVPVVVPVEEPVVVVEQVVELPSIDTPTPIVSIVEAPQVDIPESVVSVIETPSVDIPAPVVNVVDIPSVDIPAPIFKAIETLQVDTPEPVVSVIEVPPVETFALFETSVVATPEQEKETESSVVEPEKETAPFVVEPEKETAPSVVEQQTTSTTETSDNAIPVLAEEAASLVYEVRDAMAGVLIGDDERTVFSDLVKSATSGTDKLEQFPSVLNDIDSTPVIVAEETAAAPFVPQTTVPSVIASESTSVVGLVDEDVRKAASNWVKDARESISKELAQERTRAGGSPADDETEVLLPFVPVEETSALIVDATTPEQLVAESVAASLAQQPAAEPRRVPTRVAADKPVDLPPVPPSPSQPTTVIPVAEVKQPQPQQQQKPSAGERIESVKRLKKPVADATTTGDATTKGPRKIKKTKKRIQGSFKRLVEVGRVVLITHGEDAGKIATIVDIVDHNRAIVDGPTTDVKRQIITYKNVVLTDIVVKCLPRTIGTKALAKFLEKEQVVETWQKTAWAQKLEARKRRANMSDFDRFKLMRLKKQQRDIVNRQSAVLRKERA
ncbi:hypothetical protein GGH95_000264, partial [Coemansia sp. RSA 1836]